jgi:hypothetical protein
MMSRMFYYARKGMGEDDTLVELINEFGSRNTMVRNIRQRIFEIFL